MFGNNNFGFWGGGGGCDGTVTSVGLSMPPAFSVSNSPVTGAGTICVQAAGIASQYIRGDGTLADLIWCNTGASTSPLFSCNSVFMRGQGNCVCCTSNAFVLGGSTNNIRHSIFGSVITGGLTNCITVTNIGTDCNCSSGIFAGANNLINFGVNSFIGAGCNNRLFNTSFSSLIGAGLSNFICNNNCSVMIGGQFNRMCADPALGNTTNNFIGLGFCNWMYQSCGFNTIVNGFCNFSCLSTLGAITSGECNRAVLTCWHFMGNGLRNSICGIVNPVNVSSILNGADNQINTTDYATILGGNNNTISNIYGVVLGGQCNTVTGCYSGVANICGVNATADCTFYFCNICALGSISGGGGLAKVVCNGASGCVAASAAANTIYYYNFTAAGCLVLPTAIGNTAVYNMKNESTTCIVACFTSGQNADGTTCILFIPNQALQFISDNANYNIY